MKDDGERGSYRPRVVVKFQDHVRIPYDESAGEYLGKSGVGLWGALEEKFQGLSLKPLFRNQEPDEIRRLVAQARKRDPSYEPPDFLTYFAVDVPANVEANDVVDAVSKWRSVESAYVEPPPVKPPDVDAGDDPRVDNQGYLDPAPDGIDAEYAWDFPGGAGAGQAVVDLEQGWNFDHEDLDAHGISLISGLNEDFYSHGTSVLGEIAAVDNTLGCVGIAPEADSVRCVSQWRSGGGYSTSEAILDAVEDMNFGDVLLLEAQTNFLSYTWVPVEVELAVFDVIRLATALGIVVVEAAGNGGEDLDALTNASGEEILNRDSSDFRDSGAIMVGAATSTAPHSRLGFSCFGSRIDCYGWGEDINTLATNGTGTDDDEYTTSFGGTSGASPIVTGAALAVQGLAEANLSRRFSPRQVRAILSDPANGTESDDPANDEIGVMPDLRAIIDDDVLNLAPDVYVRDFVGDTGDPHSNMISMSPDVILTNDSVADPQAAFGPGSGTENDYDVGDDAEIGQENYVYVRARNRGGSDAASVKATVYWSEVSTLVTPDMWSRVGSTVLPNIPDGDQLTVSDAISWPAADIPPEGHYCFVALIGNGSDPAPTPADFEDFDDFKEFIRVNNNATWKNFNVVDNVPPPDAGTGDYVPLEFLAAGAPDRARKMRLEIVGRLPRQADVILEVPEQFAHLLRGPGRPVKEDRRKGARYVPINPSGRTPFEHGLFPAGARIPLRLLVKIPEELRAREFDIFARQFHQDHEVGRVTWRLAPPQQDCDEPDTKRPENPQQKG